MISNKIFEDVADERDRLRTELAAAHARIAELEAEKRYYQDLIATPEAKTIARAEQAEAQLADVRESLGELLQIINSPFLFGNANKINAAITKARATLAHISHLPTSSHIPQPDHKPGETQISIDNPPDPS